MIGICKLCDQSRELQKSHAIGRTVFNRILASTKNNVLLNISPKINVITNTNDQWDTHQLCSACESLFNKQYENYSIQALRGKYDSIKIIKTQLGVSYSGLKQEKIILYIISILWRAAHSKHSAYRGISMPEQLNDYLKFIFLGNKPILPNFLNVRMRILTDDMKLISHEGLQKVLISPYTYKEKNNVIYAMLFEGWYIEVFFLKPSFKDRQKYGFLGNGKPVFFVPYIDFSEIPELMKSLVHGKAIVENSLITC